MSPHSVIEQSLRPVAIPAAAAGVALPGWTALDFTVQQQAQDEWCWAAVAVSAARFLGRPAPATQCAAASTVLGGMDCCAAPGACNQQHSMTDALRVLGLLRQKVMGDISLDDVRAEIAARRPVPIHIAWDGGGGGHIAAIAAVRDDGRKVVVADPLYGPAELGVQTLRTRYRDVGRWNETYFLT